MDASYNDVQEWKYKDLVGVFGADPKKSKTYQVKTKQEAEHLFKDEKFSSAPHLQASLLLVWICINTDKSSSSNFTCPKKMHQRH